MSTPASDEADQGGENKPSFPVGLYPEIEPHFTGMLKVCGGKHEIYYEVSGNPEGVPAIFLHGGPGGGCDERSRRFFDPQFYKIVCLDQRGCGRSVPNAADDFEASLIENNTPSLGEWSGKQFCCYDFLLLSCCSQWPLLA